MAYSDITLTQLKDQFGISNFQKHLFEKMPPLEISEWLQKCLEIAAELPVRSEKAKSEWIVAPILTELRNRNDKFFTIYSGENLVGDASQGLNGECDFILSKESGSFDINCPIIQVVEAKKNDVEVGIAQCAAQMLGAKIFNQKKGEPTEYVYGCVTTGTEWLFLKLNDVLTIDKRKYFLNELGEILAVFQHILDFYKPK
jgi:hypothetical protein